LLLSEPFSFIIRGASLRLAKRGASLRLAKDRLLTHND
jgi:hypothetical protein